MVRLRTSGALLLALLLTAFGVYSATHPIDFQVYHGVARQVLQGDYALYPEGLDASTGRPIVPGFRYAPAVAWLFAPLGWLRLELAAYLFFWAKIAGVALVAVLVRRLLHAGSRPLRTLVLVPALAAGGYLAEEFRNGNAHVLTLTVMVSAIYLVERGRTLAPSVLMALAIAIKATPALLVAYFVVQGRWRLGAATAVALALLLAAPSLVVGARGNVALLKGFAAAATQTIDQPANHSLRGVLFRFLHRDAGADPSFPDVRVANLSAFAVNGLWLALCAVVVGLMAPGLVRRSAEPDAAMLDYAAVVTAALVLAPHTQRIYFSVLFFPACVLVALLAKHPRLRHARAARLALGASIAAGTIVPPLLPGRVAALGYEVVSPYLWTTLWLLGVLVMLSRELKRALVSDRAVPG